MVSRWFKRVRGVGGAIAAALVVGFLIFTGGAGFGSVSDEEMTAYVADRGGGFTTKGLVRALEKFADHGGYSDWSEVRLRGLSLSGPNIVTATVSMAGDPDVNDSVSWDGRSLWTSPGATSPAPAFTPADIAALVDDPRVFVAAMRREFPDDVTEYSITCSPATMGDGPPLIIGGMGNDRGGMTFTFDAATGALTGKERM